MDWGHWKRWARERSELACAIANQKVGPARCAEEVVVGVERERCGRIERQEGFEL